MPILIRAHRFGLALVVLAATGSVARAQAPTAAQALKLKPVQKDVDYDQPKAEDLAKCTIKAQKVGGKTGWLVQNGSGQVLRNFVDTNNDNVVDQWSYFKDGIEVYRDIDSTHNNKADQYRWLNTAGIRWGLDKNEDRVIDSWKLISAEEVSAELADALRDKDKARFERLLITPAELRTLGLGTAKTEEIQRRLTAAPAAFDDYVKSQTIVTPQSKWVYFGGSRPGLYALGTDDSTADVTYYENTVAMLETDGKPGQVPLGTLIQVGDSWRLVEAPGESATPVFTNGPSSTGTGENSPTGLDAETQKLLGALEDLDKHPTTDPAKMITQTERRAEIIERLAELTKTDDDREQWTRQLADVLSTAVQNASWQAGLDRLTALQKKLSDADQKELAAYVRFRFLTAEYNLKLQDPQVDYTKVQKKWLEDLKEFVGENPKSPDSAEAMLQLGIAEELSGDENNAIKWYQRVVDGFPKAQSAGKCAGAIRRLNSVGKSISVKGKSLGGKTVDLAQLKGKVVLIHYWDSSINVCQTDLPQIDKMLTKYGDGFAVIGVSMDNDLNAFQAFVTNDPVTWPQIWEDGGLTNRLATEMGIFTVPTMILVDAKGQVVNRSASALTLDADLKTMLKPRIANKGPKANN